jgi:hypothetical protein
MGIIILALFTAWSCCMIKLRKWLLVLKIFFDTRYFLRLKGL